MIALTITGLFAGCMLIAALYDLFTMTIPNRIVLILIAGFAVAAAVTGMGWVVIASHIGVALVVLIAGFALFNFGVLGGGDAKLAAAAALWLGLSQTGLFLIFTGLLGGALALMLLGFRLAPLPQPAAQIGWVARLHHSQTGVPYGMAIGPAALLVFPQSVWTSLLA